ncbi:hypothetical protein L6R49_20145 [Myxococcota bacterium]|nr:hypothetical protein [Myxococcota bacterium]
MNRAQLPWLSVFSLLACSDYRLNPEKDDPGVPLEETAAAADSGGADDSDDSEIVVVDPEDCEVKVSPAGTVAVNGACESTGGPVADPFNLTVELSYNAGSSGSSVTPVVGNLSDDNGDGTIDVLDVPDIAFTTLYSNTLVAISGDDGALLFELPGAAGDAGVAIADVDADGVSEVVTVNNKGRVIAVDGAGTIEWTSPALGLPTFPQLTVADLDGDGLPEVIADLAVLNGEDGSLAATLGNVTTRHRTPVAADLDQDGQQEILLGEHVFDANGALLWTTGATGMGTFAAVADVDGDPGGEVYIVSKNQVYLYDEDGTQLKRASLPGEEPNPGPPCVADFDGDGEVELVVPVGTTLAAFNHKLTNLWDVPMQDASGSAGCSGYDLDGDGAYEVIIADEVALRILDGATGATLYENYSHSSMTYWEYPVIADVDLDGSAEIVLVSNAALINVKVVGHAGDGWPRSGPTWGTHDFAVSNLNPDGTVPARPDAPWTTHNVFRARPSVDDPAAPDLIARIDDLCVADCDNGPIKLAVQVSNQGAVDLPAGTLWSLYRVDGELQTLLGTGSLDALPAGVAAEGFAIELSPDDLGTSGLLFVVDDDGAGFSRHDECDETNNTAAWVDPLCQ